MSSGHSGLRFQPLRLRDGTCRKEGLRGLAWTRESVKAGAVSAPPALTRLAGDMTSDERLGTI
jgi:hypothetical protein